jgi:hypothetical protein
MNYDARPCPFCRAEIKHITSLAKSFTPPRVYHEWHHPQNNCFIAHHFGDAPLLSANETPESAANALARWNSRT